MCPAEDISVQAEPDRGPTILIVEDETLVRMSTAEHLRDAGFTVVEAANGEEAQAVLQAGVKVDLIFSDVNMPGDVDGIALAEWAATHGNAPPIMLTSGLPTMLQRARERCPHVKALISKPYVLEALEQNIRAALPKRAAD